MYRNQIYQLGEESRMTCAASRNDFSQDTPLPGTPGSTFFISTTTPIFTVNAAKNNGMNTGPRKIFCYILLAFIHTFYTSVTSAQSYGLGFPAMK